ncbi:Mur ligase [Myxococcota bacterium]|nr:Mur ligase [Myxococcota bacterium]
MRLVDSRRLLGPNLVTATPAVIAEVELEEHETPEQALALWASELARMRTAVGLTETQVWTRRHQGGAALVFTAPFDLLLPATDVNEWAIASATELLASRPALPVEPRAAELRAALDAARDPRMMALRDAARAHRVPFLVDDKSLTLGMGWRGHTWPRDALPAVADVPWDKLGEIPVALVTGTNGKTTSTRLVARMGRHAGLVTGSTSTDGVSIDGQLVERGDYTGPAGALAVLRRADVELAVLETARGGILRRGLAVERCSASLITNVSADHLGDYGVDDLDTMRLVKGVIGTIARTVVLNAEDPGLAALAPRFPGRIVFFSVDAANETFRAHVDTGGEGWTVHDGQIAKISRKTVVTPIARVTEVPLTFGGQARYNVENALGAAGLASAIGLSEIAIATGLHTFTSSPTDNPGRGNLFRVGEVRVLVDFGHNPAGVRSVLGFANNVAAGRPLTIIFGMPGDRLDEELHAVARELAAARPTRVLLRELWHYLRGREPGVVPALLARALEAEGLTPSHLSLEHDEVTALRRALDAAAPGELVVVLPHVETEAVDALLAERGATRL